MGRVEGKQRQTNESGMCRPALLHTSVDITVVFSTYHVLNFMAQDIIVGVPILGLRFYGIICSPSLQACSIELEHPA